MGDNTVSRQNFPAFPNVIAQDRTDKQPMLQFLGIISVLM